MRKKKSIRRAKFTSNQEYTLWLGKVNQSNARATKYIKEYSIEEHSVHNINIYLCFTILDPGRQTRSRPALPVHMPALPARGRSALSVYQVKSYDGIQGNSRKGVGRCRLTCFLHYTYTLSIYPSAHKQLRKHLPTPFCEFLFIFQN